MSKTPAGRGLRLLREAQNRSGYTRSKNALSSKLLTAAPEIKTARHHFGARFAFWKLSFSYFLKPGFDPGGETAPCARGHVRRTSFAMRSDRWQWVHL